MSLCIMFIPNMVGTEWVSNAELKCLSHKVIQSPLYKNIMIN